MTRNFVLVLGVLLLVSCGGGSTDRQAAKQEEADSRWPETGSFSYSFTLSCRGSYCDSHSNCATGRQTFEKKSAYCLALRDRGFNRDCALRSREQRYRQECGNDFEESNLPMFFVSGHDPRLERRCQVGSEGESPNFEAQGEYCRYLSNEARHQGCFWDRRKEEFEYSKCSGSFSSEPKPVVTPTPTPTSTPTFTPTPTPTPTEVPEEPAIVKELKAAGIDVEIFHPPGHEYGERPFQERLAGFYGELEAAKHLILARREVISSLTLTTFTHYRRPDWGSSSAKPYLALDVDWNRGDLYTYFGLFDRRAALEKAVGLTIDFGVEYLDEMVTRLDYLTANAAEIRAAVPAILSLEFEGFSALYLQNRKLILDRMQYSTALGSFLRTAAVFAPLFTYLDSLNVKLDLNFGSRENYDELKPLTGMLASGEDFRAAVNTLGLKELQVSAYCDKPNYWQSMGVVMLGASPACMAIWPKAVAGLKTLGHANKSLGIEVSTDIRELTEPFFIASGRLERTLKEIKAKTSVIKKVTLGYSSAFSYGTLRIGYSDSEEEYLKVLRSIR